MKAKWKYIGLWLTDWIVLAILYFTKIVAWVVDFFRDRIAADMFWELIKLFSLPIIMVSIIAVGLNIWIFKINLKKFILIQLFFAVCVWLGIILSIRLLPGI